MQRHTKHLAPILLVLMLAGCAARNPATVPTPPPIQAANALNELAQVTNAAAVTLRAALNEGKLSQADFNIAAKVGIAVSDTGKDLNAELRSPDNWDTQKLRMRNIIISSGLAELAKVLPPTARAIMATCLATFNVVSATVGGPIL